MTLQTDDLIRILSRSPQSRPFIGINGAAGLLFAACLVATILALGIRPDMAGSFPPATMLYKTILLSAALTLFALALKNAAMPLPRTNRHGIYAAALSIFLGLSLGWEWVSSSPEAIIGLLALPNFSLCLWAVTAFGTLGTIFLCALLRQYAPTDERKAAGLIGMAAAGAGALGYSIHCPIDSPTFIAISYGLPVLFIGMVARLILPRFLRW